jgi:hypothetical protein
MMNIFKAERAIYEDKQTSNGKKIREKLLPSEASEKVLLQSLNLVKIRICQSAQWENWITL